MYCKLLKLDSKRPFLDFLISVGEAGDFECGTDLTAEAKTAGVV